METKEMVKALSEMTLRTNCEMKMAEIMKLPKTVRPTGVFREYLEDRKLVKDYDDYINGRLKELVERKVKELTVGEYNYIIEHKDIFFPNEKAKKSRVVPKDEDSDRKAVKVKKKTETKDTPKSDVVWVDKPKKSKKE